VNTTFDRKIIAGFALALTLLVAIGALLYRSAGNQAETARWVARTHEVLARIQELILRLTDAETARRGFIMTGSNRYLVHYTNAVERVDRVFSSLRELTRDDRLQQQTCDALQPLIQQRFEVYGNSIAAQLKGETAEIQLKLTEKGQEIMEQIRTLIGQMDAAERALLVSRQEAVKASLQETKQFALVGAAASLVALVVVFAVSLSENSRRRHAESALLKSNDQLEARVRQRTAELSQALAGYKQAEREIKKLNEELEQRVAERTGQLESANKELEAFSYSVSHDLRAPLRHIGGFVEMLREEASSVLTGKGQQYLAVISDSATRMGRLIDNLLDFSRMGRMELRKTQVNTGDLVKEVVHEIRRETEGRDVGWEIDPLPTVTGDRSMLKQVWVNLMSNAVKYTRPRERARIRIRCAENEEAEWQFSVADNGAGFDMRYADKLFGVFQRLHKADEFEGTGIGLANVRRIVHRHGGRTWAEGKVNEGATFYFTLPKSAR
jgi:signal transduction histidine kinase